MGTIGYGSMYPATDLANSVVTAESLVSLVVTAVATGLVFAKFGRTTARVVFARNVVVSQLDGAPTLVVRIGNERHNRILDASFRVTLVRTERPAPDVVFYRMYDLKLARERTATLERFYTLLHRIDASSPLNGYDTAALARDEVELHVIVAGTDDTTLQPVHAIHAYYDRDIRFGSRFADLLREEPDGTLAADVRKFHEVVTDPENGVT
jgi:inward rectifier potassium channel